MYDPQTDVDRGLAVVADLCGVVMRVGRQGGDDRLRFVREGAKRIIGALYASAEVGMQATLDKLTP